jgi:hypothetical protein
MRLIKDKTQNVQRLEVYCLALKTIFHVLQHVLHGLQLNGLPPVSRRHELRLHHALRHLHLLHLLLLLLLQPRPLALRPHVQGLHRLPRHVLFVHCLASPAREAAPVRLWLLFAAAADGGSVFGAAAFAPFGVLRLGPLRLSVHGRSVHYLDSGCAAGSSYWPEACRHATCLAASV